MKSRAGAERSSAWLIEDGAGIRLGLMAGGRKRGVYILSFSLGAVALPTGLIAVVNEGSLTGVVLVLAGMALLVQSLEYFWG